MNRNKRYLKPNHKLPQRWDNYTAMGDVVPGTRFLPFKTPLKEEICQKTLAVGNWFTPAMLLEKAPNLKLIIDLTQTDRFYNREEFIRNGVKYKKIYCRGGGKALPPRHIIHEFTRTIDSFLQSDDALDRDGLIGVHCTHGLNRTGYLICKYMVQRSGIPARQAVDAFQTARGHEMERNLYVSDILGTYLPPSAYHRQLSSRGSASSYHPYSPLDRCYEESRGSYSDRYIPPYRRNRPS